MNRAHNFSAGPAALPVEVLQEIQEELFNFKDIGAAAFEISHRSREFLDLFDQTRTKSYQLLKLNPDEYEILFLQGGARFLFSILPLNFAAPEQSIDLVHTGVWTEAAAAEIRISRALRIVASGEDSQFRKLPSLRASQISESSAYLHYCSNNTIYGTQFQEFTLSPQTPSVIDMSSDILSRPFHYSQFDLVFASAQKNLGVAGLTFVAIRKSFLETARTDLPAYLQLKTHAAKDSMFNTPCTFAIYTTHKVLKWIEKKGGLEKIGEINQQKAQKLYSYIDSSDFYQGYANPDDRSQMNVVFRIREGDEVLEKRFVEQAAASRLIGLKGHRILGGLRASIYNAVTLSDVEHLIDFMDEFQSTYR